ncbi:MAG: HAD hydrolase family protein [Clostridia bacterium]|nr:HAD hydrolase family protein [Clostridia bacterium]
MPYAFFLDIDGTIIDNTFVPDENRKAIEEARAAGHLVLLNTGRGLRFIPDRVWQSFTFDGVVCGAGAYASLHGKVLHSHTLAPEEAMADAAFLMSKAQPFIIEGENLVLGWGVDLRHDYWLPLSSPEELMGKYADAGVQKINLPGQVPEEVAAYLSRRYLIIQHPTYAETSILGCDKGRGMRAVMEQLPGDFVSVAIGDSLNDLEMLEAADISVAMGNSIDRVKALCSYETAPVRDAGVAVAIRAIMAGRHLTVKVLQNF